MDNLQLDRGFTAALASGALANGTTTGTVQTTATIPFAIDGVFYSKAATNNIPIAYAGPSVYGTPADGSFVGALGGSTRLYGLYLDSAGAVSVLPGPIVNSAELAAGAASLQFPSSIRNRVCFGVLRIALTAGTAFVPNVTALNAAGVTATYLNLAGLPGEPLRA